MFVRSSMERAVTYNKSAASIVLNPMTVTFVDENIVTAAELKACYGSRISILPEDIAEAIIEEDKANTGNEEVDAFLNGETDKLPESTEEITEDEANKVLENLPDKCKECHADGKTPAVEDCDKCKAEETEDSKEETEDSKEGAKEDAGKQPPKKSSKTKSTKKANK